MEFNDKLTKAFKLGRTDRMRIYQSNAFIDPVEIDAVDITLDTLSDKAFKKIEKQLNNVLTNHKKKGLSNEFGYIIEVGKNNADYTQLVAIHDNERATPNNLLKLHKYLKSQVTPNDLKLKP